MIIIRQFFDDVVRPNTKAQLENPTDLRMAVNVVLSLDALVGVIFSAMLP